MFKSRSSQKSQQTAAVQGPWGTSGSTGSRTQESTCPLRVAQSSGFHPPEAQLANRALCCHHASSCGCHSVLADPSPVHSLYARPHTRRWDARQTDTAPTLDHWRHTPGLRHLAPNPATTQTSQPGASPMTPPLGQVAQGVPHGPLKTQLSPLLAAPPPGSPWQAAPRKSLSWRQRPAAFLRTFSPGSISQASPGVRSGGAMGDGLDKSNLLL